MKIKERMTQFFRRNRSKLGAYSAAATAAAIALTILFNLLISQLPSHVTEADLSGQHLYTVSQVSVDYLQGLEEDIELIVTAKKSDVDSRVQRFLDKYAALSPHLSLRYVDPLVYPSVLSQYNAAENSILVRCEATGRQESIDLSQVIGFDLYSYYYYGSYVETDFDCEGQLTAAVNLVVSQEKVQAYTLSGHGEQALPDSVQEMLQRSQLQLQEVNLLLNNGLPEDCQLLIAYGPTADISQAEADMLRSYLAGGGQLLYLMGTGDSSLPGWEALLASYGMTVAPGYIADAQRYFQQNPYALFPVLDASSELMNGVQSDGLVLVYNARGLTLEEAPEGVTLSSFMTTSENGYAVTETEQQPGTYVLGALAQLEGGGRLTVITAQTLLASDIIDYYTSLSNTTVFVNCATAGFENVSSIAVDAVSLEEGYNTITTAGVWSIVYVILLPLMVLTLGLVHWLRRRKQ